MKINHCDFPEGILYDIENFVWLTNSGKIVTLGITAILAAVAGKISSIKLKPIGTVLEKGKSVGTIESGRYFGVVRTPVSGKIVEINNSIISEPKLANDFPYTSGWFAKIEADDNLEGLEPINDCHEKISSAIQRLHVRCFVAFPDHEMFEIGVECSAALAKLDELLTKIQDGEVVHIVSDDPTADIEMTRWSEQKDQNLMETRKEGNLYHFIVKKR